MWSPEPDDSSHGAVGDLGPDFVVQDQQLPSFAEKPLAEGLSGGRRAGPLTSKGLPQRASSRASCWLTAPWDRLRCAAALVTLRRSATVAKALSRPISRLRAIHPLSFLMRAIAIISFERSCMHFMVVGALLCFMRIMTMNIERLAAFSDGARGGNPAGVVILDVFPDAAVMQSVAPRSAIPRPSSRCGVMTNGMSAISRPAMEVPFCGHATVALGAALADRQGDGLFPLRLHNGGKASVEGRASGSLASATLTSPRPTSRAVPPSYLAESLALFGWSCRRSGSESCRPPSRMPARSTCCWQWQIDSFLARCAMTSKKGKTLMDAAGLATISIGLRREPDTNSTRAIPSPRAVFTRIRRPARRRRRWGAICGKSPGRIEGRIAIVQGEDMGVPCRLSVGIGREEEDGILVGGSVRRM